MDYSVTTLLTRGLPDYFAIALIPRVPARSVYQPTGHATHTRPQCDTFDNLRHHYPI
jgi:hypothetical protein